MGQRGFSQATKASWKNINTVLMRTPPKVYSYVYTLQIMDTASLSLPRFRLLHAIMDKIFYLYTADFLDNYKHRVDSAYKHVRTRNFLHYTIGLLI